MKPISAAERNQTHAPHLEDILQDAVSQLETLADPSAFPPPRRPTIHFGRKDRNSPHCARSARFDFEPPAPSRKWPGATSSSKSIHQRDFKLACGYKAWKARVVSARSPLPPPRRREEKKHGREGNIFHALPPEVCRDVVPRRRPQKKNLASSKHVTHSTSPTTPAKKPTPRDQPLSLLTLPPEIRNQIISLLVLSPTNLAASLRLIQPCPKLRRGTKPLVRRFPLEPNLSLVNHQLHHETLSIFHGSNTFTIANIQFVAKRTGGEFDSVLRPLSTSTADALTAWKPRAQWVQKLQSLEVKFGVVNTGFTPNHPKMHYIVYTIRKVRGGDGGQELRIGVRAEKTRHRGVSFVGEVSTCLCVAEASAEQMRDEYREEAVGRDLVAVVLRLAEMKKERIEGVEEWRCRGCGFGVGGAGAF
ncbi:hypothetical protein TI39_contig472g00002 [Zymoseptoria brevis]|uniref:F-box domain-containing protein n=1 Tax=Zymoseptoria brevis TaxID=1047168 RepID=A0A0F4GJS9_9PEZI|nr:hypothetical protein TI39_contig472g00002 [Zymoseptoria brevis]